MQRPQRYSSIVTIALAGALFVVVGLATRGTRESGEPAAATPAPGEEIRGNLLPEPMPKPAFTLDDTDGNPFDFRAQTEGALAFLFFGFTHCPDICPVHMANLAAVLRDLPYAARRQIEVVFVSVDPERDTPERLRDWLDAFDPRFVGLRGTLEEVNPILAELWLPPAIHEEPDEDGNYMVGHSAAILAFTPDGLLRARYPFGTRQADWAHVLPKLLRMDREAATGAAGTAEPGRRSDALAYVPAPAAAGPAALYLTLPNPSGVSDALIAARAPAIAAAVEMHRSTHHGDSATMEPVPEVSVPAAGSLVLEPGGYHLMLRELERPLVPGDTFTVELQLREAGALDVRAVVIIATPLFIYLTFSELPLYAADELAPRVHGISARADQQVAGLLMKIGGMFIHLIAATIIFLRWSSREEAGRTPDRV